MKRWIWLALAAVPLAAAAITMVAVPKAPEWTTSSPQALEAYLAGEAALRKMYNEEAREHFYHALELDPEFLVAKWRVAQVSPEEDPSLAPGQGEQFGPVRIVEIVYVAAIIGQRTGWLNVVQQLFYQRGAAGAR